MSTLPIPPALRRPNATASGWGGRTTGVLLCAVLAGAAMVAGRSGWLQAHGLSALTLAIVLGMVLGHAGAARAPGVQPGVVFSKQVLLRLGVMLYGFRLTVQDIGLVGLEGVLIDFAVLGSTFLLACWLGTRCFKMDRTEAMLIGAGSSICGAAAVMATGPVVRARAEQVTVAVATVVVFGTIAIFLYPLLHQLAATWSLIPGDVHRFGVYAGSTIQEVAQVVAAAQSVGSAAADTAVIAKMVRVMMLAPFLVLVSAWLARHPVARREADGAEVPAGRISIPWFAVGFVIVVLFNSLHWLPAPVVHGLVQADTFFLAMAMAALGVSTHVSVVRRAGVKPLLLASLLFVWLVVGGALINQAVPAALALLH